MNEEHQYDFVIIGSGLGGLECGYILADEGYSVCVLEKNHQLGGNLQVFSREKVAFDTGVHYIGGLEEGQNLHQMFKYFGLMDKLKLVKMDSKFDRITFNGDPVEYNHAQGYDAFAKSLIEQFPEEESAINEYCKTVQEICNHFPLYNLEYSQESYLEDKVLGIGVKDYLEQLTSNEKLQAVLGGSNMLYAGISDKTPLYVHALIVNTYIESSYRCIDGGAQIAKHLAKSIREMGGVVLKRTEVTSFEYEGKEISCAVTEGGERFYGKNFISNIHPQDTLDMVEDGRVRKAYVNRIKSLENSVSAFILNIVCKPESFEYQNYNYYHHKTWDVWKGVDESAETWPSSYMFSTPAHSENQKYSKGIIVLAYMKYSEVQEWEKTLRTVVKPSERGEAYEKFKKEKEEVVLKEVEKKFPHIRDCIKTVYSSTPLTYRDYIGNSDGSIYGVVKDYNAPLKTFITPKTKIPNLYLTGQNINLHGILGVSISSLVTCSEFIDKKYLLDKINNA
ncbi:phytoene desaturase family protein [Owenweeksia hongkongensis]|uniref:phytoene desaturase family protein n=1 Tax=Owenweeksia hongkongensis TaxID=253245 RepID=UPI003A94A6A5